MPHTLTLEGALAKVLLSSTNPALLLLARQLKEAKSEAAIELVAYGGEDSWFPGDALYTHKNVLYEMLNPLGDHMAFPSSCRTNGLGVSLELFTYSPSHLQVSSSYNFYPYTNPTLFMLSLI